MTLVLSMSNFDRTIQIADGRLTPLQRAEVLARPLDDLAAKSGLLICADARLAYSFTGLAYTGKFGSRTFDTHRWLKNAILDATQPSNDAESIVKKLRELLTDEFQTNPAILGVQKADRRLSVMLSGSLNTVRGGVHTGWILTNYQRSFDFARSFEHDLPEATREFCVATWQQRLSLGQDYAHIERLGNWRSVGDAEMLRLGRLLADRRPVHALVDAGVKALQKASNSHRSSGRVGKDAFVLVIPHDWNISCSTEWGVGSVVKARWHRAPDVLLASCAGQANWLSLEIQKVADRQQPYGDVSMPRVHRNAPCPCGSGHKYRDCHKLLNAIRGR